MQTSIAKEIAASLKSQITEVEKSVIEEKLTDKNVNMMRVFFILIGIYFDNNLKKSFKDNSKILIASPNVFFQSFFGSNKEDVQRTL